MADAFDIFEIEPRFDLDPAELAERHRALSTVLHPDRYAGRSSGERRQALGQAIEVNAAFRTLKSPLTRAEALLARLGLDGHEPEALPPEFLMEILELREELKALGRAKNAAEVERLAARVKRESEERERLLALAFARAGSTSDARPIHRLLAELRYFHRFSEEASAILDEIS